METLIEIHSLDRSYAGVDQLIFNNFNFKLTEGEFVFLVGKSGTGKTTLVKFLLGQLLPPLKTIFFRKEDIARFSAKETQDYRRKLGVIFQDYKLLETMAVWENVTYPLVIDGVDPVEQYTKVESILSKLWLSDKKNISCQTLSWWEKQRVSIVRSLVSDPEFIIADEPTGNLDRNNSQIIADSMIDLHDLWHTILFITHDQRLMEYVLEKHPKVRVVDIE